VNAKHVPRAGRLIAAAAAAALFISSFLTWGAAGQSNFLVVFGAVNRRGGFFADTSKSAWDAYPVAAAALALLAVVIIVATRLDRVRLLLLALIGSLAGLGFAIDQIAHPPADASVLPLGFIRPPRAKFVPHVFATTAGTGETLAAVALVAVVIGLTVALTSRLTEALAFAPDSPSNDSG
jgi:hypothetical protein